MGYKKINDNILFNIADAIRAKLGFASYYKPHEFASAIMSIEGTPSIQQLIVSSNSIYSVPEGVDGFAPVVVRVPNSYGAIDEGKVVSNASLVAQTSMNVSANGVYDTTMNNEVVVEVEGADTSDATLSSGSQMLSGITAYARGSKYTGTIPMYNGSIDGGSGSVPSYDYYSGSYVITPSTVSQAFPTAGKIMSADLTVDAYSVPSSAETYSGSYTITPSVFSQAFPTAGKLMSQDLTVEAYSVDYYSGSYVIEPSTIPFSIETMGKTLLSDLQFNAYSSGGSERTYQGAYTVDPSFIQQVLPTSGKVMVSDLTINAMGNFASITISANGVVYPSMYSADAFSCVNVQIYPSESIIQYFNSIPYYVFTKDPIISNAYAPSASYIEHGAFMSCIALKQISFPICEYIGAQAFGHCEALESAVFPMASYVGQFAFAYCYSLSTIDFASCETLDWGAFESCSALANISMPLVSFISSAVFEHCENLSAVSFPSCETIGESAFYGCSNLQEISFPVCTEISSAAFAFCDALTSVDFPVCSRMGRFAFDRCHSLASVEFAICESIGGYAFQFNSALTDISFPHCKTVGDNAFWFCAGLSTISLPEVTLIDYNAFGYCSALESVYLLGSSIVSLSFGSGSAPFKGTPIEDGNGKIYVPSSLYNAYVNNSMWMEYSDHIVGM